MILIVLNILIALQIHCLKIKRCKNVKSLSPCYFCSPASWLPFLEVTTLCGDQCFHYRVEILCEVYFLKLIFINVINTGHESYALSVVGRR